MQPRSRLAYILLAIFLGGFGIHNFYAGYTKKAVIQLLLTVLLGWTVIVPVAVFVWIILDIIKVTTDADGVPMSN